MIKKHALTLSGLVIMILAFGWNVLLVDETVPNDANIGAGVLFMAGIGFMIVGLASAYARRSSAAPPPPPDPVS